MKKRNITIFSSIYLLTANINCSYGSFNINQLDALFKTSPQALGTLTQNMANSGMDPAEFVNKVGDLKKVVTLLGALPGDNVEKQVQAAITEVNKTGLTLFKAFEETHQAVDETHDAKGDDLLKKIQKHTNLIEDIKNAKSLKGAINLADQALGDEESKGPLLKKIRDSAHRIDNSTDVLFNAHNNLEKTLGDNKDRKTLLELLYDNIKAIKSDATTLQGAIDDTGVLTGGQGTLHGQIGLAIARTNHAASHLYEALENINEAIDGEKNELILPALKEEISNIKSGASHLHHAIKSLKELLGEEGKGTLEEDLKEAITLTDSSALNLKEAIDKTSTLMGGKDSLYQKARNTLNCIDPSANTVKEALNNVSKTIDEANEGPILTALHQEIQEIKPNSKSLKQAIHATQELVGPVGGTGSLYERIETRMGFFKEARETLNQNINGNSGDPLLPALQEETKKIKPDAKSLKKAIDETTKKTGGTGPLYGQIDFALTRTDHTAPDLYKALQNVNKAIDGEKNELILLALNKEIKLIDPSAPNLQQARKNVNKSINGKTDEVLLEALQKVKALLFTSSSNCYYSQNQQTPYGSEAVKAFLKTDYSIKHNNNPKAKALDENATFLEIVEKLLCATCVE